MPATEAARKDASKEASEEVGGSRHPGDGELEALRAGCYALLSGVLARPPDRETLDSLTHLEGDDTPLGQSLAGLSRAALEAPEAIEDEYSRLFYGMGQGGEVLPYASYYVTGSLHAEPLVKLRADMERLGIAPSGLNAEPEDHIAFVLEIMHGLIEGSFACGAADLATQMRFFDAHIAPWAGDFLRELEAASSADFYAAVARVGQAFLDIESDAFRIAA